MVLGTAMQTLRRRSSTDEQEVLTYLADILIDTYAAESAVLRASAAADGKAQDAALHVDAAAVFTHDAAGRIELTRARRSRRWPRATRCARCSRRCAGC